VKELLRKVFGVIKANAPIRDQIIHPKMKFDVMAWHNAAGNHWFDDHPELFDISQHEGHCIRAYFQQEDYNNQSHVKELLDWGLIED
jgi:hypothetical protein